MTLLGADIPAVSLAVLAALALGGRWWSVAFREPAPRRSGGAPGQPSRDLDAVARRRRLPSLLLLTATALLAASCSGRGEQEVAARPVVPVAVEQVPPSPAEDVPAALFVSLSPEVRSAVNADQPGFPPPLVDPAELVDGGPEPDGIPPIDRPTFLRTADVDFLADDEPVLALDVGGDARAYPVQVLIWHEIVNDTVGGVPVAVTYCPLCNTALAWERRVGERVLTFGTSGKLWNSSLVMWDRQTRSLWSHVTGQAIVGWLAGAQLAQHPVPIVSWARWRSAHPEGLVLSRETGYERDYGRNPYPGYDDVDEPPFLFEGEVDGRLAPKERVVAVTRDGRSLAVVLEHLRRRRVVEADLGGTPVVVLWAPGTASALEADRVDGGRDVGATGVFVAELDGRPVRLRPDGDGFRDDRGSVWNLDGVAVAGPAAGRRLDRVPHVDTFWFAWAAFRPETTVIAG